MANWRWRLTRLTRRLWVRVSLMGLLGVLAALVAAVAEKYIPWDLPIRIDADSVESLLSVIASSMLAVTTFSLSIMAAAFAIAANSATPRAIPLLMEDSTSQRVLSHFMGSFLFSIVGLIVLKTGAYGDRGRFVLFVVTVAVIAQVVISLLQWIDRLTRLGRVAETAQRVEEATQQAITDRLERPWLGGVRLKDLKRDVPSGAIPISGNTVGNVEVVDMDALSACCDAIDADIYVAAIPGTFVYPDTILAWIGPHARDTLDDVDAGEDCNDVTIRITASAPDDAARLTAACESVRSAFSIGKARTFDRDPRFGLAVLREIAQRALSPAVNDPGTAIDIISRMTRLLMMWSSRSENYPNQPPEHPRVHVPALQSHDLFEDAFMLLARDSASMVEVQLRLHKSLVHLSRHGDLDSRAAALEQARIALEHAEATLPLETDRARIRKLWA